MHAALFAALESIGAVQLSISSISQGSKLVTDWKTSQLPLTEPSKDVNMYCICRYLFSEGFV